MSAAAPNVDVIVDGEEVNDNDLIAMVIDRDMFQPDMAAVVLSNQNDVWVPKLKVGATVEIKVGDAKKQIFKGEIVGVEPSYKGGDKTTVTFRAMNKLHRLLRKRVSKTFTDKTDKDILSAVVGEAGLSLDYKGPTITYKHVYQHNQTALEFLRMRASRLGLHVWCVDSKVFCKEPELDKEGTLELAVDKGGLLRHFRPRLSSASVIKKVTVKGWNPETKELISASESALPSKLGSKKAVDASPLAADETFTVDHPIWTQAEATAIAKGKIRDLNLSFITGEAECGGTPDADLGMVVKIKANGEAQDPFNGGYYVMGITHRFTQPKGPEGGYATILRLARDAQDG